MGSPFAICNLQFAIEGNSNRKLQIANRQSLALLLFMLGVAADHAHDAFAADDLAVFTDSTNAGSYFHDCTFSTQTARASSRGLKNGRIGLYSRKKYYFQIRHEVRCRGRSKIAS
jgi:hypothetical protein